MFNDTRTTFNDSDNVYVKPVSKVAGYIRSFKTVIITLPMILANGLL